MAVVPSRQLIIQPLHTPGERITAQSTCETFALDFMISQADADEIVAAQENFPVMAPPSEALVGQDLGADDEALRGVGVAERLLCHGGFGEAFAQRDAFVGRLPIQSHSCGICRGRKRSRSCQKPLPVHPTQQSILVIISFTY